MVVVGTDAHKYSHTFVATDEVNRPGESGDSLI